MKTVRNLRRRAHSLGLGALGKEVWTKGVAVGLLIATTRPLLENSRHRAAHS